MSKEKQTKIVFAIMLTLNIFESALFFLIIPYSVYIGFINMILMWLLLIMDFALWIGTSITANIIAGRSPKSRWYSVLSPFLALSLVANFGVYGNEIGELLILLSMVLVACLFIGLVPFLSSMAYQRKKNKIETVNSLVKFDENNETV